MKSKIGIAIICLSIITTLSACKNGSLLNKTKLAEVESESYVLDIPEDFTESEVDVEFAKMWDSPDYAETEFQITAYDEGAYDYTGVSMPKTFEQFSNSEEQYEGLKREKVYFDYSEENGYEQYFAVTKITYSEGNPVYEMQKIMAGGKKGIPPVVQYYATKVIVDQSDRTKAVKVNIYANEKGDPNLMKKIIDSFKMN